MADGTKEPKHPPISTDGPTYRGRHRSSNGRLSRITVTLPDDLLEAADTRVLERRRDAKGFNRSALIEEALQIYLDERT